MTKPKLLIATDCFLPRWDGISRFLSEVVPRLAQEFHIDIIAPDYGPTTLEGAHLIKMPTWGFSIGDYPPARVHRRTLRRLVHDCDVVFTQSLGPIGSAAIRAARRARKPCVAFTHSLEWELVPRAVGVQILKRLLQRFTKYYARRLYNRCTSIIAPSEGTADQLVWQGVEPPKHIAHLGVNCARFRPAAKALAKERIGFKAGDFIVGFHGRIAREKDLITLLRAFIRLNHPRKRLVLVGEGIPSLMERFARMRNVWVTGRQENVVGFLQAMDVYALPSLTETTSLAVLEAMSCALPVVSTPVGYVADYIDDGKNGFFFEPHHNFQLYRHIDRLMRSRALRQRMGAAARKTVNERFRWSDTAKQIEKVLKESMPA